MARGDARSGRESAPDSPAIRMLEALGAGDDLGALAVCGDATVVSAENMSWSCRGRDEIHDMLVRARHRFPGLTFESRTRHIGFGLVIDEARVRDDSGADHDVDDHVDAPPAVSESDVESSAAGRDPGGPDVHPMWDEPVTERRNLMSVWSDGGVREARPTPLNMPVRVTVRHDDLQVHEVTLSFPAALLKRALGRYVDPLEMSLSEVQSAFIAPVGAGFTTYQLARPELKVAPPPPVESEPASDREPPRRRGRWLAPVLVALIALVAGGGWWAVEGRSAHDTAGPTAAVSDQPTTQVSTGPTTSPSPSASTGASSSTAPKVTQAKPSSVPSHKPNITLKSDLAFGFNSASLSRAAKQRIDEVAKQIRDNSLTGTIYVDGYTDNLGSNAYGLVLSQRRANAVSNYLGSQLVGVTGLTIVSTGHGEADPVASNATEAGRVANRRVTITLPRP